MKIKVKKKPSVQLSLSKQIEKRIKAAFNSSTKEKINVIRTLTSEFHWKYYWAIKNRDFSILKYYLTDATYQHLMKNFCDPCFTRGMLRTVYQMVVSGMCIRISPVKSEEDRIIYDAISIPTEETLFDLWEKSKSKKDRKVKKTVKKKDSGVRTGSPMKVRLKRPKGINSRA